MSLSNVPYEFIVDPDIPFFLPIHDTDRADLNFVDQAEKGFPIKRFQASILPDQADPSLDIVPYIREKALWKIESMHNNAIEDNTQKNNK